MRDSGQIRDMQTTTKKPSKIETCSVLTKNTQLKTSKFFRGETHFCKIFSLAYVMRCFQLSQKSNLSLRETNLATGALCCSIVQVLN